MGKFSSPHHFRFFDMVYAKYHALFKISTYKKFFAKKSNNYLVIKKIDRDVYKCSLYIKNPHASEKILNDKEEIPNNNYN
jgi:hypothetical protein